MCGYHNYELKVIKLEPEIIIGNGKRHRHKCMRPVLLTVDDDLQVVQAIKRDLRHQYGKRFRILKAGSGQKALELVKQLKLQNESVALLLVDQRMPQMSGVELLEQSKLGFNGEGLKHNTPICYCDFIFGQRNHSG